MPSCKDGKVPEGANGRCVKACRPGQTRNAKKRCVNNKTPRAKKATTQKACINGKVREGVNGRCVKSCGPGQMRNAKGRCANDKSQ